MAFKIDKTTIILAIEFLAIKFLKISIPIIVKIEASIANIEKKL